MNALSIRHRTTYRYREPVRLGPHRLMLRPRESHDLRLLSSTLELTPAASVSWTNDVFGNTVATASFSDLADGLTIESLALVELGASPWPVFDIAASAIRYPFHYSAEELTDLGSLATPQYVDPLGQLTEWGQGFVRGQQTDTLALLKDLVAGVADATSYQSREEGRNAVTIADSRAPLGIVPGFRRPVRRSSAQPRLRCTDHLWLSLQSRPRLGRSDRSGLDPSPGPKSFCPEPAGSPSIRPTKA